MTEYKIITQTASADTTQLTFTDELITDNSLIDFYYTDGTVYTESVSQSGTSVYLTISEHTNTVGVACVINNVTSYEPYDDTEMQNALSDLSESIQTIESNIETIDGILSDHTDVLSSHSSEIINLQNSKQDELTPGDNITIVDNVISASGGSGNGDIYSTNEVEIGTFLDKTLYRKMIPTSLGASTSSFTITSYVPTDAMYIIRCDHIKLLEGFSSEVGLSIWKSGSDWKAKAFESTSAGGTMYFIFEYTKVGD